MPAWGVFLATSNLSPDGTPGAFHACSVFLGSPPKLAPPKTGDVQQVREAAQSRRAALSTCPPPFLRRSRADFPQALCVVVTRPHPSTPRWQVVRSQAWRVYG